MSSIMVSKLRKTCLVIGVGLSLIYMPDCTARIPAKSSSAVDTVSLMPPAKSASYTFYEEVLQDTMKALHAYKRAEKQQEAFLKNSIPWLLEWEAAPSHIGNDGEMHFYLKRHPQFIPIFAPHHEHHPDPNSKHG